MKELSTCLVARSGQAWLSLHTQWSQNPVGPFAQPHISEPDQELRERERQDIKTLCGDKNAA